MLVGMVRVELVEVRDQIPDLRQLGQVDLALADQLEDDLAELGEGVVAAAAGQGVVEARPALAGAALERLAHGAGLGQGRAQQGAERAAQLRGPEPPTSSLPCHAPSVYRRSVVTRWASAALGTWWIAAAAACPPPEPVAPLPPVSAGKVRVRVFTEPAPVKKVSTAGRFLFVATDDALQRWDEQGSVIAMTADHGLTGNHIVALANDPGRSWMWILTDGGLGHYDAAAEVYSETTPPPPALGLDYAQLAKDGVASLAPAAEGGVWLGTTKGLFYVSDRGGWVATPITDPIDALVQDASGWLWIASKGGLVARRPTGELVKIGPANGCDVVTPRLVVEAPGDRVLVVGADAQGRERLAIGKQATWRSYRALPEQKWDAATRHGDGIVVLGGGRVYRITAAGASATRVRPLARDGMRLVPLSGAASTDWLIDPLEVAVPHGATVLGSTGEHLLIGTRDLGTARYGGGDTQPRGWLRRQQMFQDASALSVACTRANDCWIATGTRQAWHWNGERFTAGGPDAVVLAVTRDPSGALFALHRAPLDKEMQISRIEPGAWKPVANVGLTTPGDAPEVSFARFTAPGTLWVGLRYRDGIERRGHGIAIVELAAGKVAYHRTEAVPDRAQKMWPVPTGVVDADVRGDTAWLATTEGIARLSGGQIRLWTEADGLRSELARGVTITPEGTVVVATRAGAGMWDGKAWSFPSALRFEINDVVAARNGQLWMATERGIAAWDGQKVRRVDTRRGLAENEVLDVTVDQFDRVWARGPGSLTLITQ
jgi:hypothetical protein